MSIQLKEKKEINISIILDFIADKLNDIVWLKVLLQALPVIWTTVILQIWRPFFYQPDGSLTKLGGGIAIGLALGSIALMIITGLKSKKDKKDNQIMDREINSYENEIELRKAITGAESTIEERRNRQLRMWIENNRPDEILCLFVDQARNPKERVNTALDELGKCFEEITELQKDEIYQSAAIAMVNTNSPKDPEWEWISQPPPEGTATLETLLSTNSAFKTVASGEPFFYANDKIKASSEGRYALDGRDSTYGNGSIICFEVGEQIGKWKIRLIISISTYGKTIVSIGDQSKGIDEKKVYEDKIRDIIVKQFEGEIKEDLLWFGLKNIKERDRKNRKR